MKFAVLRFPGSNCDQDCFHALRDDMGLETEYVWHKTETLDGFDAIVVPGGFSYGDYLRTGAIARFSPVMQAVQRDAEAGKLVIGVCNGFQILCEAGLLPGALIRNRSLRFVCEGVAVRVETSDSPFTNQCPTGTVLRIPVAHGEGCYYADDDTLRDLETHRQVLVRYVDAKTGAPAVGANPNGSRSDIAGICNRARNVFGLMPHPDRACHRRLGSEDGKPIFASMIHHLKPASPAKPATPAPVGEMNRVSSDAVQNINIAATWSAFETFHPMTNAAAAEPAITPELIAKHGLTPDEYTRIETILGRPPNFTELGVFSVMWSEHCSYKNSRLELRKFPTEGPRVLVKAGEENAGVIDVGDGWGVAFKMESHNHPSAIEPFQGAATGVGGIIRDIFTMGARPVFSLNSLRFGPIQGDTEAARANRRLFTGVVEGIAHYGNCIGIPTIGGEIYFDESYQGNPLVNVFCLGVLRHEQIARGAAKGVGNPVYYVGAETGRDGLAGAAFASRDLTEESKEDRPAVQVGDPFKEKLLLEACLELLQTDAVAGIQDMGAAGLTCSTCETASRGGSGVSIDLNLVPQRETGMTPYEILLSESQERMLIIVKAGREAEVQAIFDKWDLPCARIGVVNDDGLMHVRVGDQTAAAIPARALADEAPLYQREAKPRPPEPPLDLATVPEPDVHDSLLRLLSHPTIASKHWVWRQYDHMVRTGTMVAPGSDAAVFYVREANKILAATSDCNALYCRLDPREGARIAVAEAARNLACSGAVPLAVTDNLNFGNPHRPENFWQLRECVEGLAEMCRAFDTPVTGGNVSLYNENPNGSIDPTPTVGMVGLIEDEKHIITQSFKAAGDTILLLGNLGDELGGSQYVAVVHSRKEGLPPRLDVDREKALHDALRALGRAGLLQSAHDCSEGGLAVALAESCVSGMALLGATVKIEAPGQRADVTLFNESQSRAVISVCAENLPAAQELLEARGVPAILLGTVGGKDLSIESSASRYAWPTTELRHAWHDTLADLMNGTSVPGDPAMV